jgi:hypothetical protein
VGIVLTLRAKGLGYGVQNRVAMPRLECAHTMQSRMLHELLEGLQYSHHAWLILCANGEYYNQHPSDRVLDILDNGPDAYFETAHMERCLAREAEDCQACKTKHIQSVQVGGGHWARPIHNATLWTNGIGSLPTIPGFLEAEKLWW